jgi:CRISPR-associated endoribonuclease Cas6
VRVRIVFILKNKGAFVPFHHQYLLDQLVEDILADMGRREEYINYNFSGLKGQTKVSKNGLHFYSSRVTLVFSSTNEGFINRFLQRLFQRREIEVGSLLLEPETVEKEERVELLDAVKYVCLSPIVLATPDTNDFYAKKFISPDTDIFSDLLYESTMNRMEKTGAYTGEQIASFYKFQILPDKDYLAKIREGEKKFARIYPVYDVLPNGDKVKLEARGYTFPFSLYAVPEVQQFLLDCGLGSYTRNGFGMLDLANPEMKKKTTPYQFSNAAANN